MAYQFLVSVKAIEAATEMTCPIGICVCVFDKEFPVTEKCCKLKLMASINGYIWAAKAPHGSFLLYQAVDIPKFRFHVPSDSRYKTVHAWSYGHPP